MKKLLSALVVLLSGCGIVIAQSHVTYPEGFTAQSNSSVRFKENKGQVSDQNYQPRPDVLFSGTDGKMVYHLKNGGVSYQLNRVDSWKQMEDDKSKDGSPRMEKQKVPDQMTIYRLDVNWHNSNSKPDIITGEPLQGVDNYYTAVCPDGVTGVRSFNDVTYQNIYPGINLKWYSKDGMLKYDYIVSPGGDYKQIQLQFEGAESLMINDNGELVIKTPLGELIEQAPIVTQNGKILPSKWVVKNNIVSFEIENIDTDKEFTIDPAVRVWGTYYGGTSYDSGNSCTTDASGNVYMVGSTQSTSVIATVGAYQSVYGGGTYDAFLVKFNSSGVRQWGTYYGGTLADYGNSCAAEASSGSVYLAGYTLSTTGIASVGSHQTAKAGASEDAFLVKFDGFGVRQWGTYYGGTLGDYGNSCAVDPLGNVYLAGYTLSTTGIATVGSHQTVYAGGGNEDAFLVKFDGLGVRQWGTYYGGTGVENGKSCTTDPSGNVYLTGMTSSTSAIATAGAHQTVYGGGSYDVLAVKFNSSGVRQWGTYYGGPGTDYGTSCATDGSGNLFTVGATSSAANVATAGAHQTVYGGGGLDALLVKLNSSGVRQWGSYYGGAGFDFSESCRTDGSGNVCLSGYTASTSGIASAGSHQTVFAAGYDAFLGKFDSNGIRQWGTYYGGTGPEYGYSCAIDASGNVYLTGYTTSTSVISTAGAHQEIYGSGGGDAFLVQFLDCPNVTVILSSQTNVSCNGGSNGSATVVPSGGTTFTYSWSPSGGTAATATGLSAGTYTCTVTNECTGTSTIAVTITQPTPIVASAASQTNVSCNAGTNGAASVSVTGGTGAYSYGWTPGNPAGDGTASVTGLTAGTWTCTVTDANSCVTTQTFNITQPTALVATAASQTNVSCNAGSNGAASVSVTGGTSSYSYDWTPGNPTGDGSASVTGLAAGTWICTVTDANSCVTTQTFNITEPTPLSASSSATSILCNGGTATVTVVGSDGTAPYTGEGTFTVTAGTYSYPVTDANGCTSNTTITVTEPTALTSSSSTTSILCNGGTATVTVAGSGGTSPYTGTGTFTVTAGTYTYTVTDANGCTTTTSITVMEPAVLAATSSSTSILCNGGTATVTVVGSGGISPYTGTGTFTVTAGTYTYTVTDANGCTSNTTVTVTEPTALTSSSSATSILCNGGNATVTVVGAGGISPYTGEGSFTQLAGTYSYTVIDANGCTSTTTITITEPTAISTSVASVNVGCNGDSTGSIDLTVSGGTAPYTFDWNSGTYITEDLTGLGAGSYAGMLTDANGCTDGSTIVITEPAVLVASVVTWTDPTSCAGNDGLIDIIVSGGTIGYTFLWNTSATSEDLSGIGAGAYNCTVTDTNGCIASVNASLNDPAAPTVTLSISIDTLCATDAAFTLSGESPVGGTFSGPGVSGGTFDPAVAGVGTHIIGYTYMDINGCTGSTTDSIYVDVCTRTALNSSLHPPFSIFPNPNNGAFTLLLNSTSATDVMIYDALGKLVNAQKVQSNVQTQMEIEASGIYLITVVTEDGQRSSLRVIVNR